LQLGRDIDDVVVPFGGEIEGESLHESGLAGLRGEFKRAEVRTQHSEFRIRAQKLPSYLTHHENWAIFFRLDIVSHA
jgi:hypothetical protein